MRKLSQATSPAVEAARKAATNAQDDDNLCHVVTLVWRVPSKYWNEEAFEEMQESLCEMGSCEIIDHSIAKGTT
jgi:hypothetical protein